MTNDQEITFLATPLHLATQHFEKLQPTNMIWQAQRTPLLIEHNTLGPIVTEGRCIVSVNALYAQPRKYLNACASTDHPKVMTDAVINCLNGAIKSVDEGTAKEWKPTHATGHPHSWGLNQPSLFAAVNNTVPDKGMNVELYRWLSKSLKKYSHIVQTSSDFFPFAFIGNDGAVMALVLSTPLTP